MEGYKYPGFDKLDADAPLWRSIPLCDVLRSFLGERDFSYIGSANFPLEMSELILFYLEYERGVDKSVLDAFAKNYFTEDSICPIEKLIELWGDEKFEQMIADLQDLAK